MSEILKLAIQKSGRLSEDSLKLIKECGINLASGAGALKVAAENFPLEILFLRDDDIPGYVEDGIADIGIVGQNVAAELEKNVNTVRELGFSKCRLSIGVSKNFEYKSIKDLDGLSIATSYPKILGDYLKEKQISSTIHEISGSVEIAPSIGLADAVCDIVSSGSTLISNGLKEVEVIYRSQAVMIGNQNLNAEKRSLIDHLDFRIKAVMRAKNKKYITLNAPNNAIDTIIDLLPGVKSPSIMPLAESGWSSIHSVVNENDFWEVIQKLREAGAEGILVLPIEKIIK